LIAMSQAYNSLRYQTETYKPNHTAIFGGIYLSLAPSGDILRCALGDLSRQGRNFSFDCAADGCVEGDGGCMFVIEHGFTEVDGQLVVDERKTPSLGTVLGVATANAGKNASLHMISGPMDQEVIQAALRQSGLFASDVDGIECEGIGKLLHDAIEVSSLSHPLRHGIDTPLAIGCVKTGAGTMEEASAMAQLVKILQGQKQALYTPLVHLVELNPHIEFFEEAVVLPNEALGHTRDSAIVGMTAHGMGGSIAHGVVNVLADKVRPQKAKTRSEFTFWPGGGGNLEVNAKPRRNYAIVGSWTSFEKAEPMENEGRGVHGFTVTLGVNRYEQFQVVLDDDFESVLHPTMPNAPQNSHLVGPDTSTASSDLMWIIDGRSREVLVAGAKVNNYGSKPVKTLETIALEGEDDAEARELAPPLAEKYYYEMNPEDMVGMPGSTYRVRLHVAGKWRLVTWDKLSDPDPAIIHVDEGNYYLVGGWSQGTFTDPMVPDAEIPGLYHAEVSMPSGGVQFQIVRNKDYGQCFFPQHMTANSSVPVVGPDLHDPYRHWRLSGRFNSVWKISFQRTIVDGKDTCSVTWERMNKT